MYLLNFFCCWLHWWQLYGQIMDIFINHFCSIFSIIPVRFRFFDGLICQN